MRPHTPFEGLRINLHGISQALKQEMLWGMKAVHMDFLKLCLQFPMKLGQ